MKDKSTSTVHDRIKHASLTIAGIGGAVMAGGAIAVQTARQFKKATGTLPTHKSKFVHGLKGLAIGAGGLYVLGRYAKGEADRINTANARLKKGERV